MTRERIRWSIGLKDRLSGEQNHRCCYCGKRMEANGNRRDYPTFEHVEPFGLGGADHPDNIVIACRGCNEERQIRSPQAKDACICGETTVDDCAWRPSNHCRVFRRLADIS